MFSCPLSRTPHTDASPGSWFGFVTLLLVVAAMLVSPRGAVGAPSGDEVRLAAADPTTGYEVLQRRSDRLIVRMPNRLIIIAQRAPTAPVVSVQAHVKSGSIYEQEHVGAGLTHFLEHLVSGGSTANRPESENNAILGRIGARTNASTSLDGVRYYIDTRAEHAIDAIDLMSDWMQHNIVAPREFEREREVIKSEFAMGQGEPGRVFWKLTQQARYAAHPARHPTIGYLDEFLTITRDELEGFYRRMYVPNNIVFSVAGDIDPQRVVDEVAARWADAEARELPELSFPVEPGLDAPREVVGQAVVRAPRLRLAWPGTALMEEHDYALDLLGVILGQGEQSRLVEPIRDAGLANTVVAYNLSFGWGKGFFGVDAEVRPPLPGEGVEAREAAFEARIAEIKAAVLREVQRIRARPVSEEELARAKRIMLARSLMGGQDVNSVADRLASDLIATGDPDYLPRWAEAVQALTAEDLQAAANAVLEPDQLITVRLMPAPPGSKATKLTRDANEAEPDAFEQKRVDLDNRRLVERFEKIDRQGGAAAIEVEPIQRFELSNGLRLLVGRSTLRPAVSMRLFHLGGLLAEGPEQSGTANAAASMLRKGAEGRSAEEIDRVLESIGASLGAQSGNNTFYVEAESLAEDWPVVLELMSDVLLRPTFPEEEWAKLQPRLLAAIDRESDTWDGRLFRLFRQRYFGDHPWSSRPLGEREVVAELDTTDLARFHLDRLSAESAVLAIFGDVEPAAVAEQAERLFASMPRKPKVSLEAPKPGTPEPGFEQAIAPKTPAVVFGFGPGVTRDHPDFAALQVLTRVLSTFPGGLLEQALRGEGGGLAYAVGAWVQTGRVPGPIAVMFNSQNPETLARGMDEVRAVLDRVRSEPVDALRLQQAKAAVMTSEALGKQTNGDRATDAALDLLYGLPPNDAERFLERVRNLTPKDLQATANRYLRNQVLAVLTPEPLPESALSPGVDAAGAPATQPASVR